MRLYLAESLKLLVDIELGLIVVVKGVGVVSGVGQFGRRRVLPVEVADGETTEGPPQFERHPGDD